MAIGRISGVNSYRARVQQSMLDILPNSEYSNPYTINFIKKVGEKVSSAEQRLILGATALITQPIIDANNKRVDEKTRKVSVARTIAKIIAGTLTGFAIRKGCIKGIDALSKIPAPNVPKWRTIFTPEHINDNTTEKFTQYKNAMGTIVALVTMTFTNFAIDAPLTRYLTNKIIQKQENKS